MSKERREETRNNQNSRETRKQHTWLFSGEGGRPEYTAGAALIVANNILQYIEDIEPITDRLMYAVLRGTVETTIIVVYTPPADRPQEEKHKAYEDLQKVIDKRKNKGPIYILGDWNARLIYPISTDEEEIMGKHTMHTNTETINRLTNSMRENRDLMMEFCMTNEMKVTNTMCRKPLEKVATYRKSKEILPDTIENITADTHEQIDYILTTKRWRNTVTDAESDTKANIYTDHFPVTCATRTRLKQENKPTQEGRSRYKKCNEAQKTRRIRKTHKKIQEKQTTG